MAAARTTSKNKSAATASPAAPPTRADRVLWVLVGLVWVFTAAALLTFDSADPPSPLVSVPNEPVANLCGRVGAIIAYHAYAVLGIGSWVVMLGLATWIGMGMTSRRVTHPLVRGLGLLLAALGVASLHALLLPGWGSLAGAPAGLAAATSVDALAVRFGGLGTFFIIAGALLVGCLLVEERIVLGLPMLAVRTWRLARRVSLPQITGLTTRPENAAATPTPPNQKKVSILQARRDRQAARDAESAIDPDAGGLGGVEAFDPDEHEVEDEYEYEYEDVEEEEDAADAPEEEDGVEDEEEYEYEYEYVDEDEDEAEEEEADEVAAPVVETKPAAAAAAAKLSRDELKEKIARLPVRMANRQTTVARDEDIPRHESFEGYKFPGLDLLEEPESNYSERMEKYVRQQAESLEEAMQTYRIDGEVKGIESGPVVTLYAVQLAPGTKVAKLQAVASDIARSLRAQNIRIVPNMVGRTTVGIEVPNLHKEKVRLKELMSGGHAEKMMLPMFLGKDASGEPLVADLTRMPHMLIAGTTGSGKSVCMNTIIMSWLYTKRPDELKLVLVDPKMVEMSQFSDIPHLMCPVVTEMGKAAAILEWAVSKMEERYELLKEAMVRDIGSYNRLGEEELVERFEPSNELEQAKIPKHLPYMVFIIDELADLMMTHKEVETSIVRIAQKARAVGIHLILATQRPQANVVTGLIKSNMPCRVSFKVASGMDSRIVLDHKGAELLLGQGDMMVLQPHASEIMRAQGTLVEDLEIRKVARFLKTIAGPSFERSLVSIRPGGADPFGDKEVDEDGLPLHERDPMFDRAVEVMIETGRGSVSLLQRRLQIGYTRASRLVDQMGRAGILGEHKGTVAREVAISMEEWQQIKAMEAADDADDSPSNIVGPGVASATGAAAADDWAATDDADVEMDIDVADEPVVAADGWDDDDQDAAETTEADVAVEPAEEEAEDEEEEWEEVDEVDADGDEEDEEEEGDEEEWEEVDEVDADAEEEDEAEKGDGVYVETIDFDEADDDEEDEVEELDAEEEEQSVRG